MKGRLLLSKPVGVGLLYVICACAVSNLAAQLAPEADAASAAVTGELVVVASPNAEVYWDGELLGRADAQGELTTKSKLGAHALKVTLATKKDFEQRVTLVASQATNIQARLGDDGLSAGTVRDNLKDGLKYVWIPPGTFMMGCSPQDKECFDNEKPSHHVSISKGFWLGEADVTVGAYKRFAAATGRQMPPELIDSGGTRQNPGWGDEAMPIVDVTWDDAQAYCGWVGGRLPTEAEWEYAARAGSTAPRYGALDEIAWYVDNSGQQHFDSARIYEEDTRNMVDGGEEYKKSVNANGNRIHPVGLKRPNQFGLYDMLGNVWEWVNDRYDEKYYQSSPSQDPAGPTSGTLRVARGGGWANIPRLIRVSKRGGADPGNRFGYGFRCGGEVFAPSSSTSSPQVATRVAPSDNDTLMRKGIEAFRKGDYAQALPSFRQVTAADPNNILAFNLAGNCSLNLKDYPSAIDSFQHALQLNPDEWHNLGVRNHLKT